MVSEKTYIRITHLERVRQAKTLWHNVLEEQDGIPLNVSGVTAEEYKQVMAILVRVEQRLEKAVKRCKS